MNNQKEGQVFWMIALVLVSLWLLGLVSGYTMGSSIHVLFAAAVTLLVVSLSQEAVTNQNLRHDLCNCGRKPDGKRQHKRLADHP
jgi:hypothetical protein